MKFSTPDEDNDKKGSNCAAENHDGCMIWWYSSCSDIFPSYQPPYVHVLQLQGIQSTLNGDEDTTVWLYHSVTPLTLHCMNMLAMSLFRI